MSATMVALDERAMILARAAELREDALRDKTYRLTPIGRLAGVYLDELAFNNYSGNTIDNREQTLAWLALDYAHKQLADLTLDDVKQFLARHWKDAAANTRAAHVSGVKVFVAWAHDRGDIPTDITRRLRPPRIKETQKVAHPPDTVRRLVVAQDSRRDRVAILLLYWCALRRNELRVIQFRHIDLARRVVTVFGKGGKVAEQHLPEPVALELERFILDNDPSGDEYLLHPSKIGRRGSWPLYADEVLWSKPLQPLSMSGIDKWWQRSTARAGLSFPMHEMRHTAGTHFHEAGRDLVATQHFMRHASAATTERIYLHNDRRVHVAEVQRLVPDPLRDETP